MKNVPEIRKDKIEKGVLIGNKSEQNPNKNEPISAPKSIIDDKLLASFTEYCRWVSKKSLRKKNNPEVENLIKSAPIVNGMKPG